MANENIEHVKWLWNGGQKYAAVLYFVNSIPSLSYPGGPDEMDRLFNQYNYWKFTGPMAGVTWWRELWHYLGGAALTLPFIYFCSICFWVPLAIALWKFSAEYYHDGKERPDLKNFVDVLFWIAGSATVTVASFSLFGPATYQ